MTLSDARAWLMKRPKREHVTASWQAAAKAVLFAAEHDYIPLAEISMRRLINGKG